MRWVLLWIMTAGLAYAEGDKAGEFDYYVLSLSWSPNWCALEGERRGSPQCDEDHGWIMHGLWPQFHRGYPSFCRTTYRAPSEAYGTVVRPPVFRKLDRDIKIAASVIEDAFVKANPELEPDMITITCKSGHIQEARICMSKDLSPVPCGRDVIKDCRMDDAIFEAIE